jgi:hypothetical protein
MQKVATNDERGNGAARVFTVRAVFGPFTS